MKIPPFLIGGTAVFWGMETGNLILGVLLFFALESVQVIKSRFSLTDEDFIKIADLSSLLLIGSVALVLLNYDARSFLRITASWLPLTLAPLILAQLYSEGDTLVIGTRLGRKSGSYSYKPLDFRIYYIIVCLFGAAAANDRSFWFFVVLSAVLAILLFCNRGGATSTGRFFVLFSLCCLLGYLGSLAMAAGHRYVLQSSFRMLSRYYHSQHVDPYKSHVNFGDTGRLKFSGRIIMRVDSSSPPPGLIREAAYPTYHRGDWLGGQNGYSYLLPVKKQQWNLIEPPHKTGKRLTVEMALPREKGMLPVPYGGFHLASSEVFSINQHRNGSVRILDGAPLVIYNLDYQRNMYRKDDIPLQEHLLLPKDELYVLEKTYASLENVGGDVVTRITALKNFFRKDFGYSLQLVGRGEYATPLGNFLLGEKNGFCEYYATATALMLRYMQIPSRYVIGYAVVEKSNLEDKYIVRDRHAHAWTEAYVDGRWITVDTTPAAWNRYDAEKASFFEPAWDLLNLLRHKYRIYRVGAGSDYTTFLTMAVILLIVFLSFRIYRRMRLDRAEEKHRHTYRTFTRLVTPFTSVIDRLTAVDDQRRGDESIAQWARRCGHWRDFDDDEFAHLYTLHLQWRFDPNDMEEQQSADLKRGAEKYLGLLSVEEQPSSRKEHSTEGNAT